MFISSYVTNGNWLHAILYTPVFIFNSVNRALRHQYMDMFLAW
jgi:hypothetical protein